MSKSMAERADPPDAEWDGHGDARPPTDAQPSPPDDAPSEPAPSEPAPSEPALTQTAAHASRRAETPLVPPHAMARRSLLALVGIMSFLACLAVGGVTMVNDRARDWRRQIADEVTIQVRPTDGGDTAKAVARAVEVAMGAPGVRSATAIKEDEAMALLEPWLGSDFDRSELPVPRLIAVRIADEANIAALRARLGAEVPGASLDDHGMWLGRLSAMANVTILMGFGVIALVLAATALSMVFATRGAMAGNRDVIEVLHLVGAEDSFIANEFQRHFLLLGLKGAGIGSAAAMFLFLLADLSGGMAGSSPEETQIRSLLGGVAPGLPAYFGAVATVLVVALVVAMTARLTVRRTLTELE